MRNSIQQFLRQQIIDSIVLLLQEKKPPENEPLEFYVDDIFRIILEKCAKHFLEKKSLRKSEELLLRELENDLKTESDLTQIEKKLIGNLTKIKPVWGEFFGTDRGLIYKTFQALYQWPCFTWQARLAYQEQRLKRSNQQTTTIQEQQSQLAHANQLVQHHENTTEFLSKRAALQFITIQQLQHELKTARQRIAALEQQHHSQQASDKSSALVC